jgi:ribosomal protein S18 acetylase RimI-like enzyme
VINNGVAVHVQHATLQDLPALASLHAMAFPGFFLTLMGPRFLKRLYRRYVIDPRAIALLAFREKAESPVGFVVGTKHTEVFFRNALLCDGFWLALFAIPALIGHPKRVLERLISALLYRGERPAEVPDAWLISSIAVAPNASRSGVGSTLIEQFVQSVRISGAAHIYLLTDVNNNEAVIKFYLRLGFNRHHDIHRPNGRRMVVLVRSL